MEQLLKIGGYLLAFIVVIAPAAIGLIKMFAEKWMDNRFGEKLTRLQRQIDQELNRAHRLHEKEFEVLAKAWELIDDAYWRSREAVSLMQQTAAFENMSDPQATAFIEACELDNWQKNQLKEITDAEKRSDYYWRALRGLKYRKCEKARFDALNYVERSGIFIRPEIKRKFLSINELILNAMLEFKLKLQAEDAGSEPFEQGKWVELRTAGEPLMASLQKDIYDRLWSSTITVDTED